MPDTEGNQTTRINLARGTIEESQVASKIYSEGSSAINSVVYSEVTLPATSDVFNPGETSAMITSEVYLSFPNQGIT